MSQTCMRVVITGATGNIEVREIIGVARRPPPRRFDKAEFVAADVARCDLYSVFAGADAVVHLAWRLQPAHRPSELLRNNVVKVVLKP
jgi:nucleoside-diphosphate-sugar epimerase